MMLSRIYDVKDHVIDASDIEWVEDAPVDLIVIHLDSRNFYPYNRRLHPVDYFEGLKLDGQLPKDTRRTDIAVTRENGKALLVFNEQDIKIGSRLMFAVEMASYTPDGG